MDREAWHAAVHGVAKSQGKKKDVHACSTRSQFADLKNNCGTNQPGKLPPNPVALTTQSLSVISLGFCVRNLGVVHLDGSGSRGVSHQFLASSPCLLVAWSLSRWLPPGDGKMESAASWGSQLLLTCSCPHALAISGGPLSPELASRVQVRGLQFGPVQQCLETLLIFTAEQDMLLPSNG